MCIPRTEEKDAFAISSVDINKFLIIKARTGATGSK